MGFLRMRLVAVLGGILGVVVGASTCAMAAPPGGPSPTPVHDSNAATGPSAQAALDPGDDPGVPMNSPGHNGLSASSLLSNAITQNPKALRILIENPLNDALFDERKRPYMHRQLADSPARDVMDYIVSCALDRTAQVHYEDPVSHATEAWNGEMGLCPSWNTKKPSVACLRLVSSCLFARTNRLHRWVPAWFGSQALSPPRDRVDVTTKYSKSDATAGLSEGTDIPAFSRGWKPGYVGRCAPQASFALSIANPSRCAKASIRVCAGIHGCGPENARLLGEKDGPCNDAPLTFTCPAGGFFGVMTRPHRAQVRLAVQAAPGKLKAIPPGASVGSYPATEKEVFSFMEGAFFGNLFEPDELSRFREVVLDNDRPKLTTGRLHDSDDDDDAVPHRHIYACYSLDNDEEAVAELNARVCAKPGLKKCFPNPPRRCHFKDPKVNERNGYHCKWRSDDGLYRECKGDDGVTYPSITVYLHERCGMSDAGCAH